MNARQFACALLLSFIIAAYPAVPFAEDENPAVFIKNVVDKCIDILKSEKNEDSQKEKVLNIMKTYFDFPSITDDLLIGLKVDDKDKSALADIFPLLLERNYGIYVKSPDNLSVEYRGYEIFDAGSKAVVHTNTKISSYHDIDLDYKLHKVNGEWKIYDLTAGGISLIDNYRAQIHKTLKPVSFPEFLIRLEKLVGKKTTY